MEIYINKAVNFMDTAYKFNTGEIVLDNFNKKYVFKIRDLAEEKRPREKLLQTGPRDLSSQELLAIILNTGTKKEEVMQMSSRILKEYGENGLVSRTDPKSLEEDFGIPLVKACQIVACFELGRRFFQKNRDGLATVRTAKEAFEYFKSMGALTKEQFRGIYLDIHYRVIHDEVISMGTLTANIVHPREVFRPAIEHSAAAIIVAHNHPSGSLEPTSSDIELTRQLAKAGAILGIEVLDHLIIGQDKFAIININF
jgi:DNA repair protein RadC